MRKLSIALGGLAAAVLFAMVMVSFATGATQEAHEHFATPEAYAKSLLEQRGWLRVVFALDVVFLTLYTSFFAAFARYLWDRGRPFVRLALGFMVGTAVADIVENHHIVAMLDAVEAGLLPSAGEITTQAVLSASKFTVSYVSLFLFGLAIPRNTRLGWALAGLLTVGILLSAVIGYSLPPASVQSFNAGRLISLIVGFVLAVAWLWNQPEPSAEFEQSR